MCAEKISKFREYCIRIQQNRLRDRIKAIEISHISNHRCRLNKMHGGSRRIGRVIENDKISIGAKTCRSDYCTQKLGRQADLSRFSTFPTTSSSPLHGTRESAQEDESQTDLSAVVAKTVFERNVVRSLIIFDL